MLIGLGHARRVLALQASSVLVNLVISIALASTWGITGVVIGTLIGGSVVWLPYLLTLRRTSEVDARVWVRRVLAPNVPGVVLQIAVGIVTFGVVDGVDRLYIVLLIVCEAASSTAQLSWPSGLSEARVPISSHA